MGVTGLHRLFQGSDEELANRREEFCGPSRSGARDAYECT
jgi:hypothetical protein